MSGVRLLLLEEGVLLGLCHMQFVVHNIPFLVVDVDFPFLGPRVGSLGPILVLPPLLPFPRIGRCSVPTMIRRPPLYCKHLRFRIPLVPLCYRHLPLTFFLILRCNGS